MRDHRKDAVSGLFLLALGVILAVLSLRHPLWNALGPQEGFYPLLVAFILIALSVVITLKGWREKPAEAGESGRPVAATSPLPIILYIGLAFLYGLFFETVGFFLSSIVFLLVTLRYVERQRWPLTVAVALSCVVGSYVLFAYLLSVPLPQGFLKW